VSESVLVLQEIGHWEGNKGYNFNRVVHLPVEGQASCVGQQSILSWNMSSQITLFRKLESAQIECNFISLTGNSVLYIHPSTCYLPSRGIKLSFSNLSKLAFVMQMPSTP
jgi:hypothetical protein